MSAAQSKPDCLLCGACCVSLQDSDYYCDVDEADCRKLSPQFVKRNVGTLSAFDGLLALIDGNTTPYAAIRTKWRTVRRGPLKGIDVCACVALKGNIMHKVSCAIYEVRPKTCKRAVKPGDRSCRWIRGELNRLAGELNDTICSYQQS